MIVARVQWASDDKFGARAQDLIALTDLIACAEGRQRPADERRLERRPAKPQRPQTTLAERSFASVRLGRAFEFCSVALAGAALATVLGGAVHDALAHPAGQVSRALATGEAR